MIFQDDTKPGDGDTRIAKMILVWDCQEPK